MSKSEGGNMSVEQNKPSEDETVTSKLWRKTKEAPFVPIGILGLIGACAYGVHSYRNRAGMSTSVYLMKYRVIAQGMVVGSITLGISISIMKKLWDKPNSSDS